MGIVAGFTSLFADAGAATAADAALTAGAMDAGTAGLIAAGTGGAAADALLAGGASASGLGTAGVLGATAAGAGFADQAAADAALGGGSAGAAAPSGVFGTGMSASQLASVAQGVGGAAASIYGTNKQSADNSAANATNAAAVAAKNQSEWNNYLMQLGLNTGGTAATGVIPSNATAVNRKLPLWFNVNVPPPVTQPGIAGAGGTVGTASQSMPFLVKRG